MACLPSGLNRFGRCCVGAKTGLCQVFFKVSRVYSVDDRVLGSLWVTRELGAPAPKNSLHVEEGVCAGEGAPGAEVSRGAAGARRTGSGPRLLGASPGGKP